MLATTVAEKHDLPAAVGTPDAADVDALSSVLEKLVVADKIRYLFCMDIEATFEPEVPFSRGTHEVIELPCVLVDLARLEIVDEFHTFVRPTIAPLTSACTELTGITTEMLSTSPSFREAMRMLDGFILKHGDKLVPRPRVGEMPAAGWPKSVGKNYTWVTDGRADIERFLCLRSCKINAVRLPPYMNGHYVDVKLLFRQHFKERTFRRLPEMLAKWGLSFEGREHSGLQDARQVARLMILLVGEAGVEVVCNRSVTMGLNYKFTARML
ncbi:ribonuclease H-like domain-containing protein [Limtongia smithiae]|uniref:ribonuclease H-like domain-containing protein n=1 Tax=Limtongia smithiae TaxID=1125753 RepID=UPI0034CFF6E4